MRAAYITDIEGQWQKLEDFTRGNALVQLDGSRIVLADDALFVFGGDAVDRGAHGRRLLRALRDAQAEYGERVVEVSVRAANDLGDHATGTVAIGLPAPASR